MILSWNYNFHFDLFKYKIHSFWRNSIIISRNFFYFKCMYVHKIYKLCVRSRASRFSILSSRLYLTRLTYKESTLASSSLKINRCFKCQRVISVFKWHSTELSEFTTKAGTCDTSCFRWWSACCWGRNQGTNRRSDDRESFFLCSR